MFEKDERYTAPDIPGVAEVIAWFGYWPTFHDAEVLSIALNRSGVSQVAIHAWEITPEISASGHYILAKHAVVTFSLEGFPENEQGIVNTEVAHFNQQNVLSSARATNGREVMNWCWRVFMALTVGLPASGWPLNSNLVPRYLNTHVEKNAVVRLLAARKRYGRLLGHGNEACACRFGRTCF